MVVIVIAGIALTTALLIIQLIGTYFVLQLRINGIIRRIATLLYSAAVMMFVVDVWQIYRLIYGPFTFEDLIAMQTLWNMAVIVQLVAIFRVISSAVKIKENGNHQDHRQENHSDY